MFTNRLYTGRSNLFDLQEDYESKVTGKSIPRPESLLEHLDPSASSGSNAVDVSGNGAGAVLSGGTTIQDQNGFHGKAFVCRGYTKITFNSGSNVLFPNDNGSMFGWVKFKTLAQRQTIFSGYDGANPTRWDFELTSSAQLAGMHHSTGFSASDPLTGKIEEGKWAFVGWTCNGGDWVHLYCNGERVATAAGNAGLNESQPLTINMRSGQNNFPADRDYGEVFVYNTELGPDEVKQLYEATRDRYEGVKREIPQEGLIAHLDAGVASSFNTGQSTWNDLSGNGNNATLYNHGYDDGSGAYINFNGSNGYAQIPYDSNTMNWSNGVSVVCVVMPNEATHVRPFINQQKTSGGDGTGTSWRLLMANASSSVDFQWNPAFNDGNNVGLNNDKGFTTGQMYFVSAGSDDSGNHFLQVNSRYTDSLFFGTNSTSGIHQGTGDIFIGINDSYNPDRYANHRGYIYMIYNRMLSQEEVSELYLYFRNRYKLIDHYRDI